jgi:hypothetical protein
VLAFEHAYAKGTQSFGGVGGSWDRVAWVRGPRWPRKIETLPWLTG